MVVVRVTVVVTEVCYCSWVIVFVWSLVPVQQIQFRKSGRRYGRDVPGAVMHAAVIKLDDVCGKRGVGWRLATRGWRIGARGAGMHLRIRRKADWRHFRVYLYVVAVLADIKHDPDHEQLVGRTLFEVYHVDIRGVLGTSHLSGYIMSPEVLNVKITEQAHGMRWH